MPLLSLTDLRTRYVTGGHVNYAVDGVSFTMEAGETVGLVGESGCGKSTLGKTILRLLDLASGSIKFEDQEISTLSQRQLLPYRRRMQMVFQDPFASLNPRQTVRRLLETPMKVHGVAKADRRRRADHIIERVGLSPAALDRFPHEFSGGQRQRIGIARSLVLRPTLLICDEPVSALDLSIQAQVLNLLVDLKRQFSLSYIFISHDLSVMRYFADRIVVMYLGKIVEIGDHGTLWKQPRHPYTQALLAAVPVADPKHKRHGATSAGEITKSSGKGCAFRSRCPIAIERCTQKNPALKSVGDRHFAACHRL